MDDAQIEAIATRAARATALELKAEARIMLESMGVDLDTPEGRNAARANWAWLTDTRLGTQIIRRTTIGAVVASAVGGFGWILSKGVLALIATAPK